jgi:hypothetical protein
MDIMANYLLYILLFLFVVFIYFLCVVFVYIFIAINLVPEVENLLFYNIQERY